MTRLLSAGTFTNSYNRPEKYLEKKIEEWCCEVFQKLLSRKGITACDYSQSHPEGHQMDFIWWTAEKQKVFWTLMSRTLLERGEIPGTSYEWLFLVQTYDQFSGELCIAVWAWLLLLFTFCFIINMHWTWNHSNQKIKIQKFSWFTKH